MYSDDKQKKVMSPNVGLAGLPLQNLNFSVQISPGLYRLFLFKRYRPQKLKSKTTFYLALLKINNLFSASAMIFFR